MLEVPSASKTLEDVLVRCPKRNNRIIPRGQGCKPYLRPLEGRNPRLLLKDDSREDLAELHLSSQKTCFSSRLSLCQSVEQ